MSEMKTTTTAIVPAPRNIEIDTLNMPQTARPAFEEKTLMIDLSKALLAAQEEGLAVVRETPGHTGKYAKMEAIIAEGKGLLNKHGLALLTLGFEQIPQLPNSKDDATTFMNRGAWGRRYARLIHGKTGQFMDFGPYDWPATCQAEKGRPLHFGWAMASTMCLGYMYRDILALPRVSEQEFKAMEKEEKEAKARDEAETRELATRLQKANEAKAAIAQSDAVKKAVAAKEAEKKAEAPAASKACPIDAPITEKIKAPLSAGVYVEKPLTEATETAKVFVEAFDKPAEAKADEKKMPEPSATPPSLPAASPAPPAASASQTDGEAALKARRVSAMKHILETREKAIGKGAMPANWASAVNGVVPGLIRPDGKGFVPEKRISLTDAELKALSKSLKTFEIGATNAA